MSDNSEKIIITGVAGFIGSNIAELLLERGHEVVGIDDFSYGSKNNLDRVIGADKFTFIQADLKVPDTLKGIASDKILHLASQKIPRYSNSYPTIYDNHLMLENCISHALETDSRLIFASTSDIYGKNQEVPFSEESDSVIGHTGIKRWAYALSKLHGEHMIRACHAEQELKFTIVRFFGSYGEHQNTTWWGGPQSVFAQNILENKKIQIHGTGKQTRTFTYVKDTIDGLFRCITDPRAENEVYNIAGNPDEEITIEGLALLICELMDVKDPNDHIEYIPYSTFGNYEDVSRRVPNINKLKSELGFSPRFSLKEGLKRTIEWQTKMHDRS